MTKRRNSERRGPPPRRPLARGRLAPEVAPRADPPSAPSAVHLPRGDLGREVAGLAPEASGLRAGAPGAAESLAQSRVAAAGESPRGTPASRTLVTPTVTSGAAASLPTPPYLPTAPRSQLQPTGASKQPAPRPYSPPPPRGQLPPEPPAPRKRFPVPPPKLPVLPEAHQRRCGVRML